MSDHDELIAALARRATLVSELGHLDKKIDLLRRKEISPEARVHCEKIRRMLLDGVDGFQTTLLPPANYEGDVPFDESDDYADAARLDDAVDRALDYFDEAVTDLPSQIAVLQLVSHVIAFDFKAAAAVATAPEAAEAVDELLDEIGDRWTQLLSAENVSAETRQATVRALAALRVPQFDSVISQFSSVAN